MLNVSILGMEDGEHAFEVSCESATIQDLFPEFIGSVQVNGILKKQGKRLTLHAQASCDANLVCDVSGEEFTQRIESELKLQYLLDSQLYSLRQSDSEGDEIILRDDEELIDITEEVRQELVIHLPMRRVAPAYVNTTFEALHPELLDDKKDSDNSESPFAALKHLNIQKN